MSDSAGEILLALLRLFVAGIIVTALYLAWRGGGLRSAKNRSSRLRDWLWLPFAVAALWVAVTLVKGQLSEPDDERATVLAFLIVTIGAVILSFLAGVVVAVVNWSRNR